MSAPIVKIEQSKSLNRPIKPVAGKKAIEAIRKSAITPSYPNQRTP
jgi:hypothetical protein